MIKNIAFDLGGVVLALSYEQAVERFEKIGLKDARSRLVSTARGIPSAITSMPCI